MLGSMRLGILAGAFAIAVAGVVAIGTGSPQKTEAGIVDPKTLVQDFFVNVEEGDVEGAMALIADDFIFTEIGGEGSFAAVGKPAFENVLIEVTGLHNSSTLTDLEAEGNVVTGVGEFSDDDSAAAGVDRFLQPFTITVNIDGKISRADFTFDTSDAQTATYLEYQASQEDGGDEEGLPPGSVIVALSAQPGGNQPGEAFVFEDAGVSFVGVFVEPGPAGVLQPAHFHTGTCAAPGPIVQPLASVLDGSSFTLLSASQAELVDTGLIINVHKSVAESSVYVSCGEVLSAPAPAPTTAPPPPAPTPGPGVTAPDTGTGPGSDSGSEVNWAAIVVLIAFASAVTAGGGVLVKRRVRD